MRKNDEGEEGAPGTKTRKEGQKQNVNKGAQKAAGGILGLIACVFKNVLGGIGAVLKNMFNNLLGKIINILYFD